MISQLGRLLYPRLSREQRRREAYGLVFAIVVGLLMALSFTLLALDAHGTWSTK